MPVGTKGASASVLQRRGCRTGTIPSARATRPPAADISDVSSAGPNDRGSRRPLGTYRNSWSRSRSRELTYPLIAIIEERLSAALLFGNLVSPVFGRSWPLPSAVKGLILSSGTSRPRTTVQINLNSGAGRPYQMNNSTVDFLPLAQRETGTRQTKLPNSKKTSCRPKSGSRKLARPYRSRSGRQSP